jgi:hypothetical protein
MICVTMRTIKGRCFAGGSQVSVAKGSTLKIVLATLSRNIYSGWALFTEGRAASSQISEVTLDQSVSHLVLTRAATERLNALASVIEERIDLYVVDDRQRSGLHHPSTASKLAKNIIVHHDTPTDAMTRRARAAIEDKYHEVVQQSPWDGDPSIPFIISTAVKMHSQHHAASAFGLDAAGTGVVVAAAGDIHTDRNIVRVPRHDEVIAELIAIHAGLVIAMKSLPSFRSAREHAVICTSSKEALDAIAYPWGGSKARRIAAGKVIEQLNKIKCGEKMERYGAIFRVIDDGEKISYQEAAKELAEIAITDYASVVDQGRFRRRKTSVLDAEETAVRNKLMSDLSTVQPQPFTEIIPESAEVAVASQGHVPLFHFPTAARKKRTRL